MFKHCVNYFEVTDLPVCWQRVYLRESQPQNEHFTHFWTHISSLTSHKRAEWLLDTGSTKSCSNFSQPRPLTSLWVQPHSSRWAPLTQPIVSSFRTLLHTFCSLRQVRQAHDKLWDLIIVDISPPAEVEHTAYSKPVIGDGSTFAFPVSRNTYCDMLLSRVSRTRYLSSCAQVACAARHRASSAGPSLTETGPILSPPTSPPPIWLSRREVLLIHFQPSSCPRHTGPHSRQYAGYHHHNLRHHNHRNPLAPLSHPHEIPEANICTQPHLSGELTVHSTRIDESNAPFPFLYCSIATDTALANVVSNSATLTNPTVTTAPFTCGLVTDTFASATDTVARGSLVAPSSIGDTGVSALPAAMAIANQVASPPQGRQDLAPARLHPNKAPADPVFRANSIFGGTRDEPKPILRPAYPSLSTSEPISGSDLGYSLCSASLMLPLSSTTHEGRYLWPPSSPPRLGASEADSEMKGAMSETSLAQPYDATNPLPNGPFPRTHLSNGPTSGLGRDYDKGGRHEDTRDLEAAVEEDEASVAHMASSSRRRRTLEVQHSPHSFESVSREKNELSSTRKFPVRLDSPTDCQTGAPDAANL
ncbi:unnamed protein product [Protopolystoma xenopodis]|uniref:Uncharacterized protein n=1 Tax=Protopolystoma xenopodis TaxID=117903 RepID=A0A3S5FG03_9PLAT|nr:unnamed protein product [Protopolystoma xenopodis]